MRIFFTVIILLMLYFPLISAETLPCNGTDVLFHCADGKTCVSRNTFCNNETDCPDGSDEFPYNASFTNRFKVQRAFASNVSRGIECQSLYSDVGIKCFLPPVYLCDHETDCYDGLDECECSHTFTCNDGVGCSLKVSFCDGKEDCSDGTDELEFNRTTKIGFQCPVTRTHVINNCILPDRYLCDGDSDCDNGIDECFCDFTPGVKKGTYIGNSNSNDKCFRCLDGSLVIPNMYVCDGIVHCEDLSDECLCSQKKNRTMLDICDLFCKNTECQCKGKLSCIPKNNDSTAPSTGQEKICVDSTSICDNTFDCGSHIDENYCTDRNPTFECYDNKKKIPRHELCNGPANCDDESDENYCAELYDYFCVDYRKFFPDVTDWDNVSETENVKLPRNYPPQFDYPFKEHRCDGIPLCGRLDDECYANCPGGSPEFCRFVEGLGKSFRCPVSGSLIVGKEICDGKPTCNDTVPEISEDELFCPNRFYCHDKGANRLPIHIPMSGRCNEILECADQSDELNCSQTTHYYCNDDGSLLFVPRTQVCDGTKDCGEGRDECEDCIHNPLSSDKKLIKSRVLVGFLWIIGLVAVIGNILVFLHQSRNLIKPQGSPSKIAQCNRILVLNLSLADAFVGIYLVALGIQDATVNEYCLLDQEWRTSSTCSTLGSMALIGTEASVFILAVMTAYRLYLVLMPYKNQKTTVTKVGIVVAWFFSMLLAFLPFTKSAADFFVSCVWYRHNQFFGLICHKELKSFVSNLVAHGGENGSFGASIKGGYTWENMFAAVKLLNSSYVPERFFGYYSAHSVCLPRLFPNPDQDVSWGYSLFLILINFCAFLFILISYLIIYRQSTKNTLATASAADKRAASLQKKISRIVLTDFCCWMPICIMAFIKVSGEYVPDDAYAVTAIILLPINAAMNPFLYSDILDIIWEKMLPVREWFNSTVCGQKLEKRREEAVKIRERKKMADYSNETKTTIAPGSSQQDTTEIGSTSQAFETKLDSTEL